MICFVSACHFYGPGYNPLFLVPAVLGPLLVLGFTPICRFERLRIDHPVFFWSCLGFMALIALHHLAFSMSPDSSFIPSIVLASFPLWAITVALLRNPTQLWIFISIVVTAFALFSAGEFLLFQQRAHAPLRDPGNYLTLLYMVGIPWLLGAVQRVWSPRFGLVASILIFVFTLAMLATHSRFGMLLIVGIVLLMHLGILASYGVAKQSVWMATLGIAIAVGVYLLIDLSGATASIAGSGAAAAQSSPRLLIWQSAWQALTEISGLNGSGLSTFSLLYPLFRSPLEQSTTGILVHNDVLQLALEGGIWLALPMLVFYAAVPVILARKLLYSSVIEKNLSFLLTLLVAMTHALVNFVFYLLPLAILVGVLCALAIRCAGEFADRAKETQAQLTLRAKVVKRVFIGFLGINILYLCLDVLSLGVLSGSSLVPGAAKIAASPDKMLSYVQVAQTLNANRGLPVFAEAKLLEQKLLDAPTPLLMSQTDLTYQRAIEKDVWNPAVKLSYANFLSRYRVDATSRVEQEALLREAFLLNRANFDSNVSLFRWHQLFGNDAAQLEIAKNGLTWCELMSRHPAARNFYSTIEIWAQEKNLSELMSRASYCQEFANRKSGGGRRKTWFMRFLESSVSMAS
ncbi:MAG: O-antigen ligase family protein [bacterium]